MAGFRFRILAAFIILLVLTLNLEEVESSTPGKYEGYKTFRVTGPQENLETLVKFRGKNGIDFLKEPSPVSSIFEIMVAPELQKRFMAFVIDHGLDYEIIVNDVGRLIDKQNKAQRRALMNRANDGEGLQMNRYLRYDEIVEYLHYLAEKYPNLCELEVIGRSYEGRPVFMIKISSDKAANKPIILMDGGMHAREWAGPMTVLYFAHQLLENQEYNIDNLRNIDWYIIPVANPDGYEYTHTDDRMWRKTRKPYGQCIGADPNRNFDYFWGGLGASNEPCSETYKGPYAFSEVEAWNVAETGMKYAPRIVMYTAVHSYGGFFLYPWGFAKISPENSEELKSCAVSATNAIKRVNGSDYIIGTSAQTLYEASGGSDDFMKGRLKIDLAYTVELPNDGDEGFIMPAEKLKVLGDQTWEGFKMLVQCPFNPEMLYMDRIWQ